MLLNFLNLKIKKYEDKSLLNSDWLRNHKKNLMCCYYNKKINIKRLNCLRTILSL